VKYGYSYAEIDATVHDLDPESLENLPVGIDSTAYQFVDLDGEGIAGVLTQVSDGSGWFYKPPLGQGRLGPVERIPLKPNLSSPGGSQILTDVDSSGDLDVVRIDGIESGFSKRK
jgi:hypothetical protein